MLRLKKCPREDFKKRFARYRRLFLFGAVLTAAGVAPGVIFAAGREVAAGAKEFLPLFFAVLTRSSLVLLGAFLLGITVYAPAWQALSALANGFLAGFTLASLLSAGEALPPMVYLAFSFLRLWLFTAYAAFGTLVSLRLFTDSPPADPREEEGRVFGGTLFNSVLFQRTFNPRFLFSYFLMFLAALLLNAALSAAYAFAFSLT